MKSVTPRPRDAVDLAGYRALRPFLFLGAGAMATRDAGLTRAFDIGVGVLALAGPVVLQGRMSSDPAVHQTQADQVLQ